MHLDLLPPMSDRFNDVVASAFSDFAVLVSAASPRQLIGGPWFFKAPKSGKTVDEHDEHYTMNIMKKVRNAMITMNII